MKTQRNSWIISLIVWVIWAIIVLGGELLQAGGDTTSLDALVSQQIVISLIIAPIFLLGVVAFLHWWKEVGFKGLDHIRDLRLLWLPALFIVGFFAIAVSSGLPAGETIKFVLINTLLVGISEELMFRGIMFHGASNKFGVMKAVWITAVLFGLIHALNGVLTGDFVGSAAQALQAIMFGVWIAALRVRLNSIYPLMIVHWLWDFALFLLSAGMAGAAPADTPILLKLLIPVLLELPLFLYGLWLLRGWKREQAEVNV